MKNEHGTEGQVNRMGVEKIRPIANVKYTEGMDGRDAHYYIGYECPKCGRAILGYKYETACDQCGTFYDWGEREPSIKIERSVMW